MALSLSTPNGSYHIIGEQAFHNDAKPPWCHCVLLSFADGDASYLSAPLAITKFELRGKDAIAYNFNPLKESVLPNFYAFIQKQKGWDSAKSIADAPVPDVLLKQAAAENALAADLVTKGGG